MCGTGGKGFTLTEVLVSMGLFGIAIPSLLGGILFSYGIIRKNAHQLTALDLARTKIEHVMGIRYSALALTSTAYNETNVPLASSGPPLANIYVTVTQSATTRKLIAVSVRWAEQRRTFDVTLRTIVSDNNVS